MDFAMDKCLQSDARQSHSLVADWIVKKITRQERNAYLAVVYMSNSTYTQAIPGHCEVQTDISNCLGLVRK